jgi:hypothetical protein
MSKTGKRNGLALSCHDHLTQKWEKEFCERGQQPTSYSQKNVFFSFISFLFLVCYLPLAAALMWRHAVWQSRGPFPGFFFVVS